MDHSTHAMGGCSMKMHFNWDTIDMCLVTTKWHIRNTKDLYISLVVIALICVGYEYLRAYARLVCDRPITPEHSSLVLRAPGISSSRLSKTFVYTIQVFLSFMIMLLFMSYNGYVMGAILAGTAVGYYLFNSEYSSSKPAFCH